MTVTPTFLYTNPMTEKLKNQKSTLAKLMASEDITVLHKKIPTAYFDVKNRILACPTFKDDISPELYDLFMGHEVGHALNTPFEGLHSTLKENRTLKGYLNVVEDVRIERKIKDKFAGLRKSFYAAYNELMQRDFFGIKDRNLQELSLIDKINLITKCGSRVSITLTDEEQVFLDASLKCETWEEVVQVATAIYEWSKENETRDESDQAITYQYSDIEDIDEDEDDFEEDYEDDFGSDGEESDVEQENSEQEDSLPDVPTGTGDVPAGASEETEDDVSESEEQIKQTGGKFGGTSYGMHDDENGARESLTEHFAHNNEDQFIDENACIKTSIDLKKNWKKIDDMYYSYTEVFNDFDNMMVITDADKADSWKLKRKEEAMQFIPLAGPGTRKYLQDKNKSIVAHMAKEFEMRQTAMRSAKAFTGKSGQLDMNRLAKYQIIEDVFKRVTYLPDGKNHGVNVLLDWSGSISHEIKDLIEQTFILSEFCNKVQIPFRIFLFSDSIIRGEDYWSSGEGKLVELLSNEMSGKKYTKGLDILSQMYMHFWKSEILQGWEPAVSEDVELLNSIFNLDPEDALYYDKRNDLNYCDLVPNNFRLGGTPLNHCLLAMRKWIPEFNKMYGIEKSIMTIITDGFSHESDLLRQSDEEWADAKSQMGSDWIGRSNMKRYLIDPYTNKTYLYHEPSDYNYGDWNRTANLLEWISETCNVTITGYFVFSKKKDFSTTTHYMPGISWEEKDEIWKTMRKTGYVFKTKGYNKLFFTYKNNLTASSDTELSDDLVDAKKSRLTSAFKKNQKSKVTSRFLTTEFIKEIA